jgi:formate dehydrogenase major subunit
MVMTEELTDDVVKADVIFPMATMLESEGTVTTNDRRILEVNQVIEPTIKYTNLYLIEKLMNVYSRNIELNDSREVLEEICRNIKVYNGYLDADQEKKRWPINSTHILFENENIFALPVHQNELSEDVIRIIEAIK